MTPAQLKKMRNAMGLTQTQLGEQLNLSYRTIRNHENSQQKRVPKWLEYSVLWIWEK